jgi:hypothetical protein
MGQRSKHQNTGKIFGFNQAYDLPENPAGQSHASWVQQDLAIISRFILLVADMLQYAIGAILIAPFEWLFRQLRMLAKHA